MKSSLKHNGTFKSSHIPEPARETGFVLQFTVSGRIYDAVTAWMLFRMSSFASVRL